MTRFFRIAAGAVILAALLCALEACTALPSADTPQEYLDKDTAATVSVVGEPLVFAHERPEVAAHMRDYVTLAAAAVNRGGHRDYVLIAYFWTTLDPHGESSGRPQGQAASVSEKLLVVADDRRIELPLAGHSARDAGIGVSVHAPPSSTALPNVYRTDLDTLRFMAAAHHLALAGNAGDPDASYELWDDQRVALAALVRLLSGER